MQVIQHDPERKGWAYVLLRGGIVLLVAGGAIGLLHDRDLLVAVLLLALVAWYFYLSFRHEGANHSLFMMVAFVVAALIGAGAEVWGIHHGHWQYHDLSDGRHFPYWLPMAWGAAFLFLYRIEKRLVNVLDIRTPQAKLILIMTVAAIFPTWGEIVAINLGVWTYTWGWQLLGVPLLAIGLLVLLHTTIFYGCSVLFRYFGVRDVLFNP